MQILADPPTHSLTLLLSRSHFPVSWLYNVHSNNKGSGFCVCWPFQTIRIGVSYARLPCSRPLIYSWMVSLWTTHHLARIRWCILGPSTPARWGGNPRASSIAWEGTLVENVLLRRLPRWRPAVSPCLPPPRQHQRRARQACRQEVLQSQIGMEAGEELLLLLQLLLQLLLPHLHHLLRPQGEWEGNCPRCRSTSPVQGRSDAVLLTWRVWKYNGCKNLSGSLVANFALSNHSDVNHPSIIMDILKIVTPLSWASRVPGEVWYQ